MTETTLTTAGLLTSAARFLTLAEKAAPHRRAGYLSAVPSLLSLAGQRGADVSVLHARLAALLLAVEVAC